MFDRNFFIKMIFFRVAYGTDSMGLRVADKDTTNGTERNTPSRPRGGRDQPATL